ncbi:universal stress protein [Haladaptatus sp. DYF46]|uniref:universal stress protein n=1 Tax=Haladaptatus sp. DYF46 TaxID=2886041 RepID=UPI001E3D973F|nr:universal stress protein [Haladaptatus sp. DYF46]
MFDSILIPTDGGDATAGAIEHGLRIARKTGATVHALYVIDLPQLRVGNADEGLSTLVDVLEEEGKEATAAVAERAREYDVPATEAMESGAPFREILDYADGHDIDLISMGTGDRSRLESYVVGSTARKVNRLSDCPVLTVRGGDEIPATEYENVLLATDGTPGSERAVEECGALAAEYDAFVHVVYVVDSRIARSGSLLKLMEDDGKRACKDAVSRVQGEGVQTRRELLRGRPAEQLLDYADEHDIDLISMGTHGRTGIDRFVMGSVAEKVIRRSERPVLTVRDLGEE